MTWNRAGQDPALRSDASEGSADEVEIFVTFEDTWVPGYEVCGLSDEGEEQAFRLRRRSDGVKLPIALSGDRIRRVEPARAIGQAGPHDGEDGSLRVSHDGPSFGSGAIGPRDEKGRFTSEGWRVGVWLTTATGRGPSTLEFDVERRAIAAFEVTEVGAEHQSFVVPARVVSALTPAPPGLGDGGRT